MEADANHDKFALLKQVATDYSALGNSYIYAHITQPGASLPSEPSPYKNEGMTILLVTKGEMEIELNLQRYTVGANNLIVLSHGVMINFFGLENSDLEFYTLSFSTEFLHSVNINFTAISIPTFVERQSPAQLLTDDECSLLLRYFELMKLNAMAKVSEQIENNIAASLMAAIVYQLVEFHYKRIESGSTAKGQRSCRNAYVQDFMKLVHVHYSRERTVSFYADKLCISPKYLSLLVKETTGKSAARWIDEFVLMEAKNLLRFSGKNVQQVAYALNFSNQSSFGKYFKHMTGQSPTEYQKS